MASVSVITCPGCGERLALDMKECPSCRKPVIISAMGSVGSLSIADANKYIIQYKKVLSENPENTAVGIAAAMCFMRLKKFDSALSVFEKAMEYDCENPEIYFYTAVCMLNGKKAFLCPRPVINKIIENINAAIALEQKGVYFLFSAYIKYDYFARKSFSVAPDFADDLRTARAYGYTQSDAATLFALLGVEMPSALADE